MSGENKGDAKTIFEHCHACQRVGIGFTLTSELPTDSKTGLYLVTNTETRHKSICTAEALVLMGLKCEKTTGLYIVDNSETGEPMICAEGLVLKDKQTKFNVILMDKKKLAEYTVCPFQNQTDTTALQKFLRTRFQGRDLEYYNLHMGSTHKPAKKCPTCKKIQPICAVCGQPGSCYNKAYSVIFCENSQTECWKWFTGDPNNGLLFEELAERRVDFCACCQM